MTNSGIVRVRGGAVGRVQRIIEQMGQMHLGPLDATDKIMESKLTDKQLLVEAYGALKVAALVCAKQTGMSYSDRREAHEIVLETIRTISNRLAEDM